MSVSKELSKCFVCFQPTEKFGKTENTFLSVVMLLRMEGHLPYPPKGSPVLIRDWEPCEPCVPKTLDLYKEYAKLPETLKKRQKHRRVKGVRTTKANVKDKETSSKKLTNDNDGRKDPIYGKNESFKCPQCPSSFPFEMSRLLSRHMQTAHSNNGPSQEEGELQQSVGQVEVPLPSQIEEGEIPQKNVVSKGPSSLQRVTFSFQRVNDRNESYQCPQCPTLVKSHDDLLTHIGVAHKKEVVQVFQCPQCPVAVKTNCQLQCHIIVVHNDAGPCNNP